MTPLPRRAQPRLRLIPAALAVLAVLVAAGVATAQDDRIVLAHRGSLQFDVEAHRVTIEDEILLPPGQEELRLGAGFTVDRIIVTDGALADVATVVEAVADADHPHQRLVVARMGMRNGGRVRVRYSGVFHQAVDDVVFSRENVGNEIVATISDEGIYLAASAGWLPWIEGALATHEMHIVTPAGFETVTQGERVLHREEEGQLVTRWVAPQPSDGLNLVANRFVVHEEPIRDDLVAMTFFLEDDARLRATYLERTRAYLEMYEEMIGPYPYAKFATVENWFPTGYGMPSWTLLGGQVLRLPFIPYTSFGHEIAHNWWGNSVFVDPGEGNWCEGLTVYCADYHYKELESAEAAREYRRNTLKDYAAYVRDPSKDFPLSEFRSRHSGATRAVGYGKSMMVFHMIDRELGRENFLNALRLVAEDHRFREAAWSDFMAAFAAAGGRDLSGFAAQWLTRTGAPDLSLGDVEFAADEVQLEIRQAEPGYELTVPVVVTDRDGATEHRVHLDGASVRVALPGRGIRQVAVDPDYHLFRRLHPAEIEATISQVLGDDAPAVVSGDKAPHLRDAARAFAVDWAEDESATLADGGTPVAGDRTTILLNPAPDVVAALAPDELRIAGGQVFLGGRRYARDDFDLVFAAADPEMPGRTHLVVLCGSADRLAGLAGRISHYGKYSWLLLPAGSGRPERGNWRPGDSPLVAAPGGRS